MVSSIECIGVSRTDRWIHILFGFFPPCACHVVFEKLRWWLVLALHGLWMDELYDMTWLMNDLTWMKKRREIRGDDFGLKWMFFYNAQRASSWILCYYDVINTYWLITAYTIYMYEHYSDLFWRCYYEFGCVRRVSTVLWRVDLVSGG